jgi:hypothetical protein
VQSRLGRDAYFTTHSVSLGALIARLPEGMEDWPAIRARNGREKPWKVPYIQVGNETWLEYQRAIEKRGLATAGGASVPTTYDVTHYGPVFAGTFHWGR